MSFLYQTQVLFSYVELSCGWNNNIVVFVVVVVHVVVAHFVVVHVSFVRVIVNPTNLPLKFG